MRQYLLIAALIALVITTGWSIFMTSKNAYLRDARDAAVLERDMALIGQAELEKYVREQRHRDRNIRPILNFLLNGEYDNADNRLDPDLVRALECLRRPGCDFTPDPQGTANPGSGKSN